MSLFGMEMESIRSTLSGWEDDCHCDNENSKTKTRNNSTTAWIQLNTVEYGSSFIESSDKGVWSKEENSRVAVTSDSKMNNPGVNPDPAPDVVPVFADFSDLASLIEEGSEFSSPDFFSLVRDHEGDEYEYRSQTSEIVQKPVDDPCQLGATSIDYFLVSQEQEQSGHNRVDYVSDTVGKNQPGRSNTTQPGQGQAITSRRNISNNLSSSSSVSNIKTCGVNREIMRYSSRTRTSRGDLRTCQGLESVDNNDFNTRPRSGHLSVNFMNPNPWPWPERQENLINSAGSCVSHSNNIIHNSGKTGYFSSSNFTLNSKMNSDSSNRATVGYYYSSDISATANSLWRYP